MNFPIFDGARVAIGPQLRALRRMRRMTQVTLGAKISVAPDTIAGLEAGRGTLSSLIPILGALGGRFEVQPDVTPLGSWLRDLRRVRQLSQEKAAASAGLAKRTIIALERGHGNLTSLCDLLQSYDISPRIMPEEEINAPASPTFEIHHGDANRILAQSDDDLYDACVTDPPFGLTPYTEEGIRDIMRCWVDGRDYDFHRSRSYMVQDWDGGVPQPSLWREVLRTLKPGAHLAVFAAPRTVDLTMMSLRLAGAEVRDTVAWISTGGFPRGPDMGNMLLKRAFKDGKASGLLPDSTKRARRYPSVASRVSARHGYVPDPDQIATVAPDAFAEFNKIKGITATLKPAHQIIVLARKSFRGALLDNVLTHGTGGFHAGMARHQVLDGTSRYPSNVVGDLPPDLQRYYFSPKAAAGEKDRFLPSGMSNNHPCAKPVLLMQWLVRLVTMPGAIVLDPFAGSAGTGIGCLLEGRQFIGIEQAPEYVTLARQRLSGWAAHAEFLRNAEFEIKN